MGKEVSQEGQPAKWQPVILILDRRLECDCGALAIFITGTVSDDEYNSMKDVDVWCQDCFDKAQKEAEEHG